MTVTSEITVFRHCGASWFAVVESSVSVDASGIIIVDLLQLSLEFLTMGSDEEQRRTSTRTAA